MQPKFQNFAKWGSIYMVPQDITMMLSDRKRNFGAIFICNIHQCLQTECNYAISGIENIAFAILVIASSQCSFIIPLG